MKVLFITCIGLCCALSQNAFAQKKVRSSNTEVKAVKPVAWNKEPDSFLGIKFGETLPGATRYCEQPVDHGSTVCLAPTVLGNYFKLEGLPSLGFGYDAAMRSQDGKPMWFEMTSQRLNFPKLEAAFIDRYGPPTSSEVVTVKTLGGAELHSKRNSWIGNRVRIDMNERHSKVDESGVVISDLVLSGENLKKNNEVAKQGASKF